MERSTRLEPLEDAIQEIRTGVACTVCRPWSHVIDSNSSSQGTFVPHLKSVFHFWQMYTFCSSIRQGKSLVSPIDNNALRTSTEFRWTLYKVDIRNGAKVLKF